MSSIVRRVEEEDARSVREFAAASGISTDEINGSFYMMEKDDRRLLAIAAVEPWENCGLLRSLVIDSHCCRLPDVLRFFDVLLKEAEQSGMEELFFVTPSPELFESLGFVQCTGAGAPERLKQMTEQNDEACVMHCLFKQHVV